MKKTNFIFFGTSEFSVDILNQLKLAGFLPKIIVTAPDSRQGRGMILTPSLVKKWALENNIPVLTPEKLKSDFISEINKETWDVFIVVSYGKIIPKKVLEIPLRGTLNVHPSLLPKYRGPTPIESAILNDDLKTGVTIMLIDEEVDHGPIIAQEVVEFSEWENKKIVSEKLAEVGGKILAKILPPYISGEISPVTQNHSEATFTKKIEKSDAEIFLEDSDRKNFLKIMAYTPHPGAFFFKNSTDDKKTRIKITEAKYENNELKITRIIPEGKKEQDFQGF